MNFRTPFPKFIDRTKLFGPLELDEFAFVIVGVGFSLILGFAFAINVALAMFGGLVMGIFGAFVIKGVKKNFAEGYLFHLMYIKGLKHPMKDNPSAKLKHHRYYKNNIKIIPDGYITTLVE